MTRRFLLGLVGRSQIVLSIILWSILLGPLHEMSHFLVGRVLFGVGVDRVQMLQGPATREFLVGDTLVSLGSDPIIWTLGIPLPAGAHIQFASERRWKEYLSVYSMQQLEAYRQRYPRRYEMLSSSDWWIDHKPGWVRIVILSAGPAIHVVLYFVSRIFVSRVTKGWSEKARESFDDVNVLIGVTNLFPLFNSDGMKIAEESAALLGFQGAAVLTYGVLIACSVVVTVFWYNPSLVRSRGSASEE